MSSVLQTPPTFSATAERHGLISMAPGENQPDIVRDPYFALNVYRVFSAGKLWTIARGEPFEVTQSETQMTLHWQPTETLPMEMRAVYTLETGDDCRLDLSVRAARDLPRLEISVSSYFDFSYEPYGVLSIVSQDDQRETQPVLWKAEDHPFYRGLYLHLTRDHDSVCARLDGRWNDENGNCVAAAAYGVPYAWPVGVMASAEAGVYVVQSSTRQACDAVSLTYSSTNQKDNIRNHNALYFSLFGGDLKAGEERTATVYQAVRRGTPTLEAIAAAMPSLQS